MQKKIYYLFIIAVAPLAGAWIEILKSVVVVNWLVSLLSQERGLKSYMLFLPEIDILSLLSQERGLK